MYTPFRASLLAAAVASLMGFSGAATAQETNVQSKVPQTSSYYAAEPADNGFVVTITGEPALSGTGSCIHSGTGAVSAGVPECGGVSFAQLETPAPPPEQPAPSAQPTPQAPPPMERITLDTDTLFAFDSAQLTDQGKAKLDQIADAASRAQSMQVHVTGYTDRIGTKEYNLGLSERRADAVRNYLESKGLPSDVISVQGLGEANPIVQCNGIKGDALIKCLQPNRRSEVEFAALEPAPNQTVQPQQQPEQQPQNQQQYPQ